MGGQSSFKYNPSNPGSTLGFHFNHMDLITGNHEVVIPL